jgi:uncharacterized protein Usg
MFGKKYPIIGTDFKEAVTPQELERELYAEKVGGYGLTTAEILYRMPDRRSLLQTFIWQEYDLCPKFPALKHFLDFWREKIEGPLHSVTVTHNGLIKPSELKPVGNEYILN